MRSSFKEFGGFVVEFPLTELKNVDSVDELLPEDSSSQESEGNGTESSETEVKWKPSQARSLVEDVVLAEKNWGPVSDSNENWNIGNIK